MGEQQEPDRRRQLWNAEAAATTSRAYHHCVPFTLPSQGIIKIDEDFTVTLTANAIFTPECTTSFQSEATTVAGPQGITDMRDSFHASITPQVYATGSATVIAWMLVIMLLITPRTFFVGGTGGRSGLRGTRGMISGATGGGSAMIGVGSRPWLQKVAALTVAISLTMATADTFRIAERQYGQGYMDGLALRDEVVGGTEIKVSRIISDIFLWLAQIQTLIRLFPRHKEKVIIKWTGFVLVVMDLVFSCLNSFMSNGGNRPNRRFVDAIPALSYLFQLALSMLYAAWVIYYSITKRRYAFYHSLMANITLVALLSILAIMTPVVFFITDIANYTVAGWGDYFRWVGAAAASVLVWEWVERIEVLEREERKDGILGREIFDGDEMLEDTPSDEITWPRDRRDGGGGGGTSSGSNNSYGMDTMANRLGRARPQQNHETPIGVTASGTNPHPRMSQRTDSPSFTQTPTPPPAVASPISRTETTSAASTVYAIRYHPINQSPLMVRRSLSADRRPRRSISEDSGQAPEHPGTSKARWQVSNSFKRSRASPPTELQRGRVIEPIVLGDGSSNALPHTYSRWALKSRLGAFAAEQGEKLREKTSRRQVEVDLPVTIIPSQPRNRTWSPDLLKQNAGPGALAVDNPTTTPSVGQDTDSSNGDVSNSSIRFTPQTWERPATRQLHSENGRHFVPSVPLANTVGLEQR